MLYVGVNIHKALSHSTVVNTAGKILSRAKIASTSAAFQNALSGYDEPLTAVLEASYCWGPIYAWLGEVTEEVVLAHPSKVRAIAEARINGQDRLGDLGPPTTDGPHPSSTRALERTHALKRVLRQRLFLVQLCTIVKNRIRALLAQHEAVSWLRSLPGVGLFLSVVIGWEVEEIQRFPTAKHFASYTGLVPSTYASSDRVVHGRLTKQGNRRLRCSFIEAVTSAVRSSPALASFYQRLCSDAGSKMRVPRQLTS